MCSVAHIKCADMTPVTVPLVCTSPPVEGKREPGDIEAHLQAIVQYSIGNVLKLLRGNVAPTRHNTVCRGERPDHPQHGCLVMLPPWQPSEPAYSAPEGCTEADGTSQLLACARGPACPFSTPPRATGCCS